MSDGVAESRGLEELSYIVNQYLRAAGLGADRSASSDIFFLLIVRVIFSGSTRRPLTRKTVSLSSDTLRLFCFWAINSISASLTFLSRCHSDIFLLYCRFLDHILESNSRAGYEDDRACANEEGTYVARNP